jgi:transcriptional regulator with XRE-family HTH domain
MTVKQALKHIEQKELAKRSGLSRSGVSLILNGHRRGTIVTLRKLAAALEVGLDALDAYLQKFPAPAKRWVKVNRKSAKDRESVAA